MKGKSNADYEATGPLKVKTWRGGYCLPALQK